MLSGRFSNTCNENEGIRWYEEISVHVTFVIVLVVDDLAVHDEVAAAGEDVDLGSTIQSITTGAQSF